MCANCPHFRVEFERDGIVRFHGLRGCPVPGESVYRIPAAEFGELCAFLCSAHAGYLVGQNILIDGGAYPGTF